MARQKVTVIGRFTLDLDLGDFALKDVAWLLQDSDSGVSVWELGTNLDETWEVEGA